MGEDRPLVVGVSGASGAPIAVRLLQALRDAGVPVALVVSAGGRAVLQAESGMDASALEALAGVSYPDHDLTAPIASGSRPTRGMVVAPCSATSVAKIALGLGDTLLTRAAFVHLKERRPLLLVPRESPMPTILLRHLTSLSEMGALILPIAPPYYLKPTHISELTDFTVGKILDHLGVPHQLYRGWKQAAA